MSPDKNPQSVGGEYSPTQMQFHLTYYQLSRITHRMMRQLYLDAEGKFDTWDTIRSITESLKEFELSLPAHLRMVNLDNQGDIIQQQGIYLHFLFNHAINICCRPLIVHRRVNKVSTPVQKHRRTYCQSLAETASHQIASNMDYAPKCGFLGRMLFSVSGIFLTAAEVLALQAIASPPRSAAADQVCGHLNKFLAILTRSPRPGPFTAQSMSILQDLIRIVIRSNEKEKPTATPHLLEANPNAQDLSLARSLSPAARDDSLFAPDLLNDFLNHNGFPMDDMIWMPERSMDV